MGSRAELSGAGGRVPQSANSVGHTFLPVVRIHWLGSVKLLRYFEPHYEEQVEWYKR